MSLLERDAGTAATKMVFFRSRTCIMSLTYKKAEYCSPVWDGNKYAGWHQKSLKCYTQDVAERIASKYGRTAFYCEYGNCWHLGSKV